VGGVEKTFDLVGMAFDRAGNRYRASIADPETDELIRHVDELLGLHRGRGSAKGKEL
jgi:hypothetical protein